MTTCSQLDYCNPCSFPSDSWTEISLDFIEGLPVSVGKSAILVVVDRLTKYGHFIPIKHPYTTKDIAQVFISEIVRLHGIPQKVVSDRDSTD